MKAESPSSSKKEEIKKLDNNELMRLFKEEGNLTALKLMYTRNKKHITSLSEEDLLTIAQNFKFNIGKVLREKYSVDQYEELSDEALVMIAQTEDSDAIEIITIRYYDYVKKRVKALRAKGMYVVGEDDDDLYQHAYIAFLKSIKNFKIETKNPFKIFVRHVVKRKIESLVETSLNNKNQSLNSAYSFNLPVTESDEDGTFEQMLKADNMMAEAKLIIEENLNEIWKLLSEVERSVWWYYAEDLTYEQIGNLVFNDDTLSKAAKIKAVDNTVQKIKVKRDEFVQKMKKEVY